MNNAEYILYKINNLQIFLLNKYHFEQIEFKPISIPAAENFSYYSTNISTKVNIRIDFFNRDVNPTFNNKFQISLSSNLGSSISLNLFYEMNYNLLDMDCFCLDSYNGSFKDKIDSFCIFLESLFNNVIIKEIIVGKKWSNDYHIDIWGNYK